MADRRVVITGLGVVTTTGIGIGPFWQALLDGCQGIRRISLFDASHFPCGLGGQIDDFSARGFVPKSYRKAVKVMARDTEIAVAAADLAFRDAGIVTRGIGPDNTNVDSRRLGCNIAAGLIATDLDELGAAVNTAVVDGKFSLKAWGSGGMGNLTPLWLLKYLPNMLACHVTIVHAAEGPSNCITCGDAAGILSIGEGARWIQRGDADVVVAGGAESKLNPMGLMRQALLKRLVTGGDADPASACRPFDARHAGTVIGEGGGLAILEDADRAAGREAKAYAEVVGFGAACDPGAFDVTRPTAGSLELAVANALRDAGVDARDVGLIGAYGTGVPGEDLCEARAWRAALGDRADRVPAFAVTGSIGSLFAGAGGMLLCATAMALHAQSVPPTVNFAAPAEGCELGLNPPARAIQAEYAVCGAFGIGGQSAACVLRRIAS